MNFTVADEGISWRQSIA